MSWLEQQQREQEQQQSAGTMCEAGRMTGSTFGAEGNDQERSSRPAPLVL